MKTLLLPSTRIKTIRSSSKLEQPRRLQKSGKTSPIGLIVAGILATSWSAVAAENIALGAAANFTILGATTVTNTGATVITGNVGLSPGSSITGFPPGSIIGGTIRINDALATQAHADAFTAYTQLAGQAFDTNLSGMDLGGLTLNPGVYRFDTAAQLNGTLRLNTGGDPNAAFHFQIGTSLITSTGAMIIPEGLGGGVSANNIFWQVGTSATIGTNTLFDGTLIADTSITFDTGSSIANGRALAINGAVTLDTNSVNFNAVAAPPVFGSFWNGSASNLWSGTNWSPDTTGTTTGTLTPNADVVFSVTGVPPQNQNTILDANTTISSLTVNDPVPVTISGPNTLTISGVGATRGITVNNGAGLTTVNSGLVLGGFSQTITVNNAAGMVINGVIGGSIGLTKAGTGRLTLTANETYTGGTLIEAGTLQIGDGITTGTSIASGGNVTVNAPGTLAINLANGETFTNNVANSGLVTTIASGINNVSGVISGTGDFTQNGTGRAILTGTNTYTGVTTVLQGTLQIGNGVIANSSITSSSLVTVSPGATLAINLANGETFSNNVTDNGLVTTIASGVNNVSGFISGTGAFTQNGTGRAILTGTNTYTGVTSVLQGTLQIGNGVVVNSSITPSSLVTVSPGATLAINLANGETFENNVTDNGLVTGIAAGTNTLSGVISGTGAVSQNGTGRTILTATNTYTGTTTVQQGTLQIGDGVIANSSITPSSLVTVNPGATLAINLANGETFENNVTDNGLVSGIASGTNTLSGVISGTGALSQEGTGRTILTATNTYTGATTVVRGTLQIGDGVIANSSITPSTPVTVNDGGILAINLANGETFSNNVIDNGLVNTIANGTNTLSGVISGTGALTQDGTGVTILTGSNTYTGDTTILRGTLRTGAPNVISTQSAVLVNGGSVFDLASNDQSVGSIANGPAGGGSITLGSATLTTGNDNSNTLFAGIISGTGGVTKVGSGVWTISGANTYTGTTQVSGGTLMAGASNVIAEQSAVIVDAGALFNLADFNQSIGSLAGAGTVALGTANLITGNDQTSTVFSGSITGAGTVNKVGSGTWELTGNNNYTGLTTVQAGVLAVDGSVAGSVLVSGGLLRGVGRIGGNVQNNATVRPGRLNSTGTLSIGGNYNQSSAGTLQIRLASPLVYDRLTVGGSARLDGTLSVSYLNGFEAEPGDVFTIITTANGVSGEFSRFIDPLATGTLLTLGVVYEGNNVLLQFVQGSFSDLIPGGMCHENDRAVARALNDLAANDSGNDLIRELNSIPIAGVASAVNLLSPEDIASIFPTGLAVSRVQTSNIERRLMDVRQATPGFDDGRYVAAEPPADGKSTASDSKQMKQVAEPIREEDRFGFFVSGIGSLGDIESTCGARGASFATGGVTVGADYRVNTGMVVGAALGYTNTSSDLRYGGDLEFQGGSASVYASLFNDGYYLNAIVGGGYGTFDSKRRTIGGFATGDTEGTHFDAFLGAGKDYHIGAFSIGPVASVRYSTFGFKKYSERGALGALEIESQSQDSLQTSLGLQASYAAHLGRVILTPSVRAQWQHEFLTDRSSVDASFGSGDSFTVRGPKIGRDAFVIDAGASAQLTPNMAIYAFYTGELGRENYTAHSVNAGLRISF